jgi:hypothetical protein
MSGMPISTLLAGAAWAKLPARATHAARMPLRINMVMLYLLVIGLDKRRLKRRKGYGRRAPLHILLPFRLLNEEIFTLTHYRAASRTLAVIS